MSKRGTSKSHIARSRARDHTGKFLREDKLEVKLIENFVEMQKVQTHLIERFDKLSTQIENLLALFEMSARQLASQPGMIATERDKEFLDKVDKLLEQNKVIAKGLTMVEDKIRERVYGVPMKPAQQTPPQQTQPTAPPFPAPRPVQIQKPLPPKDEDEIIPSPFQNRPSPTFQ